jgi:glycosyltransferase involved in cell wall biosynthesis
MLAAEPPSRFGAGVRTYHFAQALADLGELTLVVTSSNAATATEPGLVSRCRQVIRAEPQSRSEHLYASPASRFSNLIRTLGVLALPWRNGWRPLLSYAGQHCSGAWGNGACDGKRSRQVLATLLHWEVCLAARFLSPPPMATFYQQEGFRQVWPQIITVLQRDNFDILWLEYSFTYSLAEAILRQQAIPELICNTHNIESDLHRRYAAVAKSGREAQWWKAQRRLLEKAEARAFQNSCLVLTCSEEDKSLALRLAPKARILVAGNGVDASYFRPSPARQQASLPTLLYTGSFPYVPNVDAVGFFIAEIFPLIKRQVPDCRFVFAGRQAQAVFDALGPQDVSVSCVSDPDDIRPEFERAWVFVVPLRAGGGTRCKILEAMAMECAVVSTPVGAEGVPYVNGEHLLLAESPGLFAGAVVRLLADSTLRLKLQNQAAAWVRRYYDWPHLCSQAIQSLQQLCP